MTASTTFSSCHAKKRTRAPGRMSTHTQACHFAQVWHDVETIKIDAVWSVVSNKRHILIYRYDHQPVTERTREALRNLY